MRAIGYGQCCWRPLWNSNAIAALATVLPTGSIWARRGDEDGWIATLKTKSRSSPCGSILWTNDSARFSTAHLLDEPGADFLHRFPAAGRASSPTQPTPAARQRLEPVRRVAV